MQVEHMLDSYNPLHHIAMVADDHSRQALEQLPKGWVEIVPYVYTNPDYIYPRADGRGVSWHTAKEMQDTHFLAGSVICPKKFADEPFLRFGKQYRYVATVMSTIPNQTHSAWTYYIDRKDGVDTVRHYKDKHHILSQITSITNLIQRNIPDTISDIVIRVRCLAYVHELSNLI